MQSKTKLVGLLVLSIVIFVNLVSEARALELVHPPIQHVSTDNSGRAEFQPVDASLGSEAIKLQEANYQKDIPSSDYLAMSSVEQVAKTKQGWLSRVWNSIVQKGNEPIKNPTLVSISSTLQRIESKIGLTRLYGKNTKALAESFLNKNIIQGIKQIGIISLKTSTIIAGAILTGLASGASWLAVTGQSTALTSFLSGLWGSLVLVAKNTLNYIRDLVVNSKIFITDIWKSFDNLTKALSRTANRISNSINKFISISTNTREEVEGWLKAGERTKSLLKWVSGSFVGVATLLSTWWSAAPAKVETPNVPAVVTANQSGPSNKKTTTVSTAANTKSASTQKNTTQGASSSVPVKPATENTSTQDLKKAQQNSSAAQTTKASSISSPKSAPASVAQKATTAKVSSGASSTAPKSSETKASTVSLSGVSSAVKGLGSAISKLGTSLANFANSDIPRFVSAGYLGSENKSSASPYQKTTMFAWIISAGAVSTLGGIWAYGRIKRRQKQNLIQEVLIS